MLKFCVLFTYSIQLSMQLDLLNGGLTFKSLTILSNTTCSYLLSSCFMFNHNKSVLWLVTPLQKLNSVYFYFMSTQGYLLEAQIHNASQLEAWCIYYIATHYNAVCRHCPKHVKNLDSSTLKGIEKKRWPPAWYILEADWYEKATKELETEKAAEKLRKSHKHIRHKRKCSCLWDHP